jgi:hypothetical protein
MCKHEERDCSCITFPSTVSQLQEGKDSDDESGEAATTVHRSLHADVKASFEELKRVQGELRAALEGKESAVVARTSIGAAVRDMERYTATPGRIVASTLRELEDAAGGVEVAEAQLWRDSALALQNVLAAQEVLQRLWLEKRDGEAKGQLRSPTPDRRNFHALGDFDTHS